MTTGCPYIENSAGIKCFTKCKASRLSGQWKVCVGSRFDPLPIGTIEIIPTGLTDVDGKELYEVFQSREYWGSCYAVSEQEARDKAIAGKLIEQLN